VVGCEGVESVKEMGGDVLPGYIHNLQYGIGNDKACGSSVLVHQKSSYYSVVWPELFLALSPLPPTCLLRLSLINLVSRALSGSESISPLPPTCLLGLMNCKSHL
jgi:hypothetical protein